MSVDTAYKLAGEQIGLNETDQKAALMDYLSTGGVNIDPAERAWCADFVNATLTQSGVSGAPSSGRARDFLEFGDPVDSPEQGDLAVFWCGALGPLGNKGHVGFFDGYDEDGNIMVLGGNQGDSVSRKSYSKHRLLGFRSYDSASGQKQATGIEELSPAPDESFSGDSPSPNPLLTQSAQPASDFNTINDGIRDLLGTKSFTQARGTPPPSGRFGRKGDMSPLSSSPVPGLGSISTYSTPGGIDTLQRGR